MRKPQLYQPDLSFGAVLRARCYKNRKSDPKVRHLKLLRCYGKKRAGYGPNVRSKNTYRQRVVFKARVVPMRGKQGIRALLAHISYLNRSGVGLNGGEPNFSYSGDRCSLEDFKKKVRHWLGDVRHFRFILSPEQGSKLDLDTYCQQVMRGIERLVGTKLQYFSVAHYNTDNPHLHVIVRGKDQWGRDLFISPALIKEGIRQLSEEVATKTLGYRSERDHKLALEASTSAQRYTGLDRAMIEEQSKSTDNCVTVEPVLAAKRAWEKDLRIRKIRRLEYLTSLGLAQKLGPITWKILPSCEPSLKAMERTKDIWKRLHFLRAKNVISAENIIVHENPVEDQWIIGKVVNKGYEDELYDKRYVVVQDLMGSFHYFSLGMYSELPGYPCKEGAIVRLGWGKRVDGTLEAMAKESGHFNAREFLGFIEEQVASGFRKLPKGIGPQDYVDLHVSRCVTLCRYGLINELRENVWSIPEDIIEKIAEFEAAHPTHKRFVSMDVRSYATLDQQIFYDGPTWLDAQIISRTTRPESTIELKESGAFSEELDEACLARLGYLDRKNIFAGTDYLEKLKDLEKENIERKLGQELGNKSNRTEGEGILERYLPLPTGLYAVCMLEDGYAVGRVTKNASSLELRDRVYLSEPMNGESLIRDARDKMPTMERLK